MALTPKQERFVAEYTVDFNATAAAIRAGYSEKTAAQMGYKLLKMQEIQETVQQEFANRQDRTHITGDYVVSKLKEIADKEAADYQDSELKYANKIRVLELLGKYAGIFDARYQKENDGGNPLTAILKSTEGDIDTDGIPEAQ